MHEYIDAPGLIQLAASIGAATATCMLLVRILEKMVTARRQLEERKLALDNRAELQSVRQALERVEYVMREQHKEHMASQQRTETRATELLTILRERAP